MAPKRRSRLRPKSIEGQFIPHLIEMNESPAWRALSLSGRRIVDRIEIEHGHHGGQENGRLPVTYDQFEDYGIDRHSIQPGIKEAIALGFIAITQQGRAGNSEFRRPTLFRLTYLSARGLPGNGCTHEWRCIGTVEQAKLVAKAARSKSAKKQNPSGGKPTGLSGETPLKTPPVSGETPPKSIVGKPTLLSIYLGEEGGGCGGTSPEPASLTMSSTGEQVASASRPKTILH